MRRLPLLLPMLLPLVLLVACDQPAAVCPQPRAAEPSGVRGDGTGDGYTDIADAVAGFRYLFADGPEPVCLDALTFDPVDFVEPGLYDAFDAFGLLHYLTEGHGRPVAGDCDQRAVDDGETDAPCARVAFDWDVPRKVFGAPGLAVTTPATLQVRNADLEPGIEAWSAGVTARDCTVTDVHLDEAVDVLEGFTHAQVHNGVATTTVVLSWLDRTALPPRGKPWPVLQVDVTGIVPAEGCLTCTVSTADEVPGFGPPMDSVLVGADASYRPATATSSFSLCAE